MPQMDRLTRLMVRVDSQIRSWWPVRWAAGRLSPEARRAMRRFLGRPSRGARAIAPTTSTIEARRASPVAATERPPFSPDGSGADPRVNVIGHFRGEFGMAEAARSLVTAAQAAGVRVALVSASARDAEGADLRFADLIGTDTPHPINIICVNANETAHLMDQVGPGVTGGRYNIGFWFWELARLPAAWQEAIDRVDEIWVASGFVGETMAGSTSKPVRRVRLAVDATPSRTYRRSEFGLSDDVFTFLFTFNLNSYVARKNPLGTINAFRKAFPGRDKRVALVLKPTNVDKGRDRMRPFQQAIDGDDRIRVIDRSMSRDEIFGLESVVDGYVSLHRSEGFGLGLAESMFLGKPVIGTAYSGNLEFMDASNSLLVDYRLTAVGEREYPFHEGQVWAEPDEDQAAELMRSLVTEPAIGQGLGARARAHMLQEFSAAAVGAGIAERLSQILDGEP
jgi:glycosyltransferase involved in cell wall biosynthesis